MSNLYDLYNSLEVRRAIDPVVVTDNTPQVGQIISMQGFQTCMFAILTGTLADAAATFTVLIEEGDDSGLSDAAPVGDDDLDPTEAIASFDEADDNDARRIMYKGSNAYVRITITPADNAGNAPLAAVAIMGGPHREPVTAQAT